MINNFDTQKIENADAAMLVYVVYKSRNRDRGPSGVDMWGQIERYIYTSAKRSSTLGQFLDKFKRKMGCDTINPRHAKTDNQADFAKYYDSGEIAVIRNDGKRNFMIDILEADESHQKKVLDVLRNQTQLVVLLVRDRLEMEKQLIWEDDINEN